MRGFRRIVGFFLKVSVVFRGERFVCVDGKMVFIGLGRVSIF